jgi:hypothetical protein
VCASHPTRASSRVFCIGRRFAEADSYAQQLFSSKFFVARGIAGLLLRLMPSEPPQVFGTIRARRASSGERLAGDVQRLRIAVNRPLRCAIKDRRAKIKVRPARREWPHEDAAFLAILFQANFYVLPEKA